MEVVYNGKEGERGGEKGNGVERKAKRRNCEENGRKLHLCSVLYLNVEENTVEPVLTLYCPP
jgi:hypothetical protein